MPLHYEQICVLSDCPFGKMTFHIFHIQDFSLQCEKVCLLSNYHLGQSIFHKYHIWSFSRQSEWFGAMSSALSSEILHQSIFHRRLIQNFSLNCEHLCGLINDLSAEMLFCKLHNWNVSHQNEWFGALSSDLFGQSIFHRFRI